ncbi:MAG: hypothetical protein DRP56_10260 [Planctomycetota bacterium]|nr:MAG: hypothetical protein DRP56_10260 [Planctomycetota bacterium]
MALVSGPRQVGKTTVCRTLCKGYLNWDNIDDRRVIMAGPAAVAQSLELDTLRRKVPVCLFDELHKFSRWKQFLKGFFDTYADQVRILITGSSRLDVYRRGGDSLMGRYFLYRMHPFSVAEAVYQDLPDPACVYRQPKTVSESDFAALWTHGGYPEPFLKRDMRFTRRWTNLRLQQFLREDVRDMTQIHQFDQLEVLVNLLTNRSSDQLIYSNLAKAIQVSNDTIRRWIATLCMLHLGFLIRPWFKNVSRSLRKEPKWFLRDWSGIEDPGQRAETFLGCHLLKAVQGWTDMGLGSFELGYLRDKNQREVDFVVIRDGRPWFLAEAKHSETKLSTALNYFQKQLKAPYAFQVVIEADAVDADCFTKARRAMVVPARTFLSQLL